MSSAKSLTPEQQARVRAALKVVIANEGGQIPAAKALHLRQQTVNKVANGGTLGVHFAMQVARVLARGLEEVTDGAPASRSAVYRELQGWETAADEVVAAKAQRRSVVKRAGEVPVPFMPARVDARLVLDVCAFWLAHAPLAERIALETDEAREDMSRAGH